MNLLKILLPCCIILLTIMVLFEQIINKIQPSNFDIFVLVLTLGAFLAIKDEK